MGEEHGFKVGDRVVTPQGEVGYLEAIYDDPVDVDVRLQTPHDKPSCVITGGFGPDQLKCGNGVVPMPRSAEWWRESDVFCAAIGDVMKDLAQQDIDRNARCSRCNTKLWCRMGATWIRRHNIGCKTCGV